MIDFQLRRTLADRAFATEMVNYAIKVHRYGASMRTVLSATLSHASSSAQMIALPLIRCPTVFFQVPPGGRVLFPAFQEFAEKNLKIARGEILAITPIVTASERRAFEQFACDNYLAFVEDSTALAINRTAANLAKVCACSELPGQPLALSTLPAPPLTSSSPFPRPPPTFQDSLCSGIHDTRLVNNSVLVNFPSEVSDDPPTPAGYPPFLTPSLLHNNFVPGQRRGLQNQRQVPARRAVQDQILRTGQTAWTGLQISVRPCLMGRMP